MSEEIQGLGVELSVTDHFSTGAKTISDRFENLRETFEKGSIAIDRARDNITRGAKLIGAGMAGLASVGATVAAYAAFEKQMALVSTVVDTTKTNMSDLSRIAQQSATSFGVSTLDAAAGMYDALSSGVDASIGSITNFMNVANKMAIGGATDLKTSVNGLTNIMNAFQNEGLTAEQISDQMFQTMNIGKSTVAELSDFVFQAASVTASAGIKFKELNAAIVSLTLQGVPTRTAMTQVKAAIVGLSRPTDELAAIFAKTRDRTAENFIKHKGLKAALEEVNKTAHSSVGAMTKLLGSQEASSAALSILSNNSQFFNKALTSIENSAGSSDDAFQKMSHTLSFQANVIKEKLIVAIQRFGEALAPIVSPLLDGLSGIVTKLAEMDPEWRKVAAGVVVFTSAALVAAGTILFVSGSFTIAQIAMTAFGITATGVLGTLWAFAWPVLAVVAAVGAAILIFTAFKEQIAAFFSGFADGFMSTAGPVIDLFIGALKELWESLKNLGSSIASIFGGDGDSAQAFKTFGSVVGKVFGVIFDVISLALSPLFLMIKLITFLVDLLAKGAAAFSSFWKSAPGDGVLGKVGKFMLHALWQDSEYDEETQKNKDRLGQDESGGFGSNLNYKPLKPSLGPKLQFPQAPDIAPTPPTMQPLFNKEQVKASQDNDFQNAEMQRQIESMASSSVPPQKLYAPKDAAPITITNKNEFQVSAVVDEGVLFKLMDKRESQQRVRRDQ